MRYESTITGRDINSIAALAEILGLAAREPSSIDEANEILYAIEDAANAALFQKA